MTTVAVIGGDTILGTRVVRMLRDDPRVERCVALGSGSGSEPGTAEYTVDLATTDLKPYLDRVDVIIDCATRIEPMPERSLVERMTTLTTDNVLLGAAGVQRYVHVSAATVYGAWANNAVPLTESALVRPVPGFDPATAAAEVERRLREWALDHPRVALVTLRVAPVVAPEGSELLALLLAGRPPVTARGEHAAVQVAHIDDVVAAIDVAAFTAAPGVYNVAGDGTVDSDSLAGLLPGRRQVALPEELIARGLDALWQTGAGDVPSSALAYLREPWTIATDKLKAQGWQPEYTSADAIRDCLSHAVYTLPPRVARWLRTGAIVGAVGALLGVLWLRRRRSD